MGNLIAVADWLGLHGDPLTPESMQFTSKPAQSCKNCLFDGQKYTICSRAGKAALRAGLEDCGEANIVYIAREMDLRQLEIEVK